MRAAWAEAKRRIDTGHPFPMHQGTVDTTEVVDFQEIAESYGLTESEYEALVERAETYHKELIKD